MWAIETVGLRKTYGAQVALEGLSLQVPEGSIFGLLGPNGAGKTTTLKLLAGLRRPSSGKILFFGQDALANSTQTRKEIGYLSENPAFYGWMTAKEYLLFVGSFSSLSRKELLMRTEYLLTLVSLHRVKEPIRNFSRGMRQRLGIAQALVSNPRLLLLDEPASSLDPVGRKELLTTIGSLRGGVTVFLSTHILADAERICDAVCILNQGKMLTQESVSSLRKKYASRTLEIETVPENEELLVKLRRAEWVDDLKKDGGSLSLRVKDITRAETEIPKLFCELRLPLKRMEAKEPSLEEIFLEVLNSGKNEGI